MVSNSEIAGPSSTQSLRVTVPEIYKILAKKKKKIKKKKNNKANFKQHAKLDRRTKQHTEFGVSASTEISADKSGGKKKKKKMNVDKTI